MDRQIRADVHGAFVELAKARSWHQEGDLNEAHDKLQEVYATAQSYQSDEQRSELSKKL